MSQGSVEPSKPRVRLAFSQRRLDVGGIDTFLYDVGRGDVPVICLHGNPDTADLWGVILENAGSLGRVIAPDLPGWGRSPAPDRTICDGSVAALDRWFEGVLEALEVDRFHLVVHDWGGLALPAAARRADRVSSLVVLDAVPMVPGFRWHWVARLIWRRARLGELSMQILTPGLLSLMIRLQQPSFRAMPGAWRDRIDVDLGPGLKDSILRLYRSADPAELERLGTHLGDLRCPALVIRGSRDPYIGRGALDALGAALGGDVVRWEVPGAGHWCLHDDPEVAQRVIAFLREHA